MGFEAQSCNPA